MKDNYNYYAQAAAMNVLSHDPLFTDVIQMARSGRRQREGVVRRMCVMRGYARVSGGVPPPA